MAGGDAAQHVYAAAVRRRATTKRCSFGCAVLWVGVIALSILLPLPAARAVLSHDGQILLSFAKQPTNQFHNSVLARYGLSTSVTNRSSHMENWNESDINPCGWAGVLCGSDSAVVRLDFSSWSLAYVNLSTLSSLRSLRELDLSSNQYADFVGLENLTGLTSLDVSDSSPRTIFLQETEMKGLPNLRYLYSDRGQFPLGGLQGLSNLRVLSLSGNGIAGDSFLGHLVNLVSLEFLDLSDNWLTGGIRHLEGLTSLTHLDLTGNNLTGIMKAPPNLQYLYAGENFFSGLPPSFFESSTLRQVNISWNLLGGPLAPPNSTVFVPALQWLDLSWNHLNGTIPVGLTEVMYLDLSNNRFSGAIPPDIGMNIDEGIVGDLLDLSGNELTGSIPQGLLQRYQSLVNLSRNYLDGNIPHDLCNRVACARGASCWSMDLSDNRLEGPLPSSLPSFLAWFSTLWLQNNNLSGDITHLLLRMPRLASIRLRGNHLTGDLTPFFTSTANDELEELDLSYNRFNVTHTTENPNPLKVIFEDRMEESSRRPFRTLRLAGNNLLGLGLPELSAPSPIKVLDLASCNLRGRISDSFISRFPNLTTLNVSDNNFLGPLPEDLPPSLQVLDISNNHLEMGNMSHYLFQGLPNLLQFSASSNNLQGPIPDVLPRTSIQVLNLSHNNLQGRIPDRLFFTLAQLKDFDFSDNKLSGPIPPGLNPSRFANNPELCGRPLRPCSTPNKLVAKLQVLWIVLVGVVLLSSTFCAVSAYQWRKQHQQDKDLIATLLERESVILMSLRQLRTATGNFSRSSQIGVGGFGIVYGGQLPDGTAVAIKKSKRMGSPLDKQKFLNEVRILSQVNHRHLVRLVGSCLENKIALLVFEYVPNGTLEDHLQGKRGIRSKLTWTQRLHIALQTAEALDYLHSAAHQPIFHRDVKSANILLDQHLNAKVADFGISKLAPKWATHVSTLAIQGTVGYIDPEYYTSLQLTSKSDVYSFGALLLELISAKFPADLLRIWKETSLVDLAISVKYKADWETFIDPVLLETLASPCGRASIESMASLAAKCLALRSRERPDMKEVRQQLQTLIYMLCNPCFDQLRNHSLQVSNEDDGSITCLSSRSSETVCHTGESFLAVT